MTTESGLMLVFVIAVAMVIVIFYLLIVRSRQVDLTGPSAPKEKPDWLATIPPSETIAATQSDGEGFALFDMDPGEKLAAPFAEQIEDIVNSLIAADPQLANSAKLDFGTAPDGSLEIWVGDKRYTDIAHLPDERLRDVVQQAVARFNEHYAK